MQEYALAQPDEATIVRRILAGEKVLFEILLRRYNQTLYRVIRGYLKDEDEVQDAMQNAYLKAFDKLYQFQGKSSFSTWLIKIGINEALMRLKRLKNEKNIYMTPSGEEDAAIRQIADRQPDPEKIIVHQEAKRILEKAVDMLPEKYRVVYLLKEVEGLPSGQVAESLGISASNVKVRLHRAKALLKDSLYRLSASNDIFEFGNARCDAVVHFVMNAIP